MWQPTINDSFLSNVIARKIDDIYIEIIKNNTSEDDDIGIMGGKTGELMFLFYYQLWKPKSNTNKKITTLIDLISRRLKTLNNLSYASGFPGIITAFKNLIDNDMLEIEIEEETKTCAKLLEINNVDFFLGSTGVMHYINQFNNENSKMLSKYWCEKILTHAVSKNNSLKWKIKFSINSEEKGYSIGLAHGLPAILIILCNIYLKCKQIEIKNVINKAINGIFEFYDEKNINGYFPTIVDENNKYHYGRKLSWCYGDLACAYSINYAGKILKDEKLMQIANKILFQCAIIKNENNDILDASFCHGSIGIAHIFSRMYNSTKRPIYQNAANYWYKVTLDKALFNNGLAGYKHFHGKEIGFKSEYGLLEGIAGIGLSLISSINQIEPNWDRCLLLS
ncbi:MAG: hypothetical protein JSU07_03895 [Bacteroidetes bacterium]|nr:hypothetical protein [Bacteroidota bacterium]